MDRWVLPLLLLALTGLQACSEDDSTGDVHAIAPVTLDAFVSDIVVSGVQGCG